MLSSQLGRSRATCRSSQGVSPLSLFHHAVGRAKKSGGRRSKQERRTKAARDELGEPAAQVVFPDPAETTAARVRTERKTEIKAIV